MNYKHNDFILRISRKSRVTYKVVFVFFLFIYVFNPPIIAFDLRKVVEILALLYLLQDIVKSKWHIRVNRTIMSIVSGFIPFFVWLSISLFVRIFTYSTSELNACVNNLFLIIIVFCRVILALWASCIYCKRNRISLNDIKNSFIIIGMIECFLVILAFLLPNVRAVFNSLISEHAEFDVVSIVINKDLQRTYGFAENLFDAFGYITFFIIIMAFADGILNQNKCELIAGILMIIMPLLNARTGLVLDIIGFALILLYCNIRNLIKYIPSTILLIIAIILGVMFILNYIPENTLSWIQGGFEDILTLATTGNRTGFFASIISNDVYPSNWIFGHGASPDNLGLGHTDIGYLQCIFRYGLVGTVLLLTAYLRIPIIGIKLTNKGKIPWLYIYIICGIISFALYLYKLYSFGSLPAHMLFLFPVIYVITNNDSIFENQNSVS